jgi:hypothetical protein
MQTGTIEEYIQRLPEDRREMVSKLRRTILQNMPKGLEETTNYGMISYVVPLSRYPKGYLGKKDTPLPFISLASQKNYVSLYLMSLYGDTKSETWFKDEYAKTGKKLSMGKSCVRWKKMEDIPFELVAKAVSRVSVARHIASYEKARGA